MMHTSKKKKKVILSRWRITRGANTQTTTKDSTQTRKKFYEIDASKKKQCNEDSLSLLDHQTIGFQPKGNILISMFRGLSMWWTYWYRVIAIV
jgi:hypothetical protein